MRPQSASGPPSGDGPRRGAQGASRRARLGSASVNLRILSEGLGVRIGQRGDELFFPDEDPAKRELARKAVAALEALPALEDSPKPWEVEHLAALLKGDPDLDLAGLYGGWRPQLGPDRLVVARSPNQRAYLEAIRRHDLVFAVGPAGTGKTYLAVAMAVEALLEGRVKRLVLTRPAVEAGERLGFLPGDLAEKIDPYLRPLYDALSDLMPADRLGRLHEKRLIEVAPLAFMRGRTLSGAFVILDEAQNTTGEQMIMFLTRLGPGSKAVVTGDPGQSDLPGGRPTGLLEAMAVLPEVEGVAFCRLGGADVVRHRLVRRILAAYDRARGSGGPGRAAGAATAPVSDSASVPVPASDAASAPASDHAPDSPGGPGGPGGPEGRGGDLP